LVAPNERSLGEQFPRFRSHPGRLAAFVRDDARVVAELEEVRGRAQRFAVAYVRPSALETDRRAGEDPRYFDWDLVRAGARYGMLSLLVPSAAGGAGGLSVHAAVVLEELCAACPGIANIFGAHALGVSPLLLGGPAHWDGVLAEVARSERSNSPLLMACAITEPEAGTDVEDPELLGRARLTSYARRVRGGYRLSGTKRFISNGSVARWITVMMPTDPRRAAETWTCFLVDARSEGFAVSRVEHKMGQRACPAAELTFDDVFVPDALVVGREGDGAPSTMIVLACSRPPVGAIATGIARGAYERLLTWLQQDADAAGLLEREHVQLVLAEMEEEIHLARQAYMDAATELDSAALGGVLSHPAVRVVEMLPARLRRRPAVRRRLNSPRMKDRTVAVLHRATNERALSRSVGLSSLAKARGADVAMRVTGAALELVGLRAGHVRVELEKLFRDAKLTQIYEGTNQLNRLEVYRGLCRRETIHCLPPLHQSAARSNGAAP
jgi:alkylation response protein AidB-like acyl-CoA dehydrogenase